VNCEPYAEIGLSEAMPDMARIEKLDKRIFNETKVTDHHAIVPTNPLAITLPLSMAVVDNTQNEDYEMSGNINSGINSILASMDLDERRIYDLIVMRMLSTSFEKDLTWELLLNNNFSFTPFKQSTNSSRTLRQVRRWPF